jgi:hypothetical protein
MCMQLVPLMLYVPNYAVIADTFIAFWNCP